MKTFLEKLLIQFEYITHPAAGWLSKQSGGGKKRRKANHVYTNLTPDGYNFRGATKKNQQLRRTPAP